MADLPIEPTDTDPDPVDPSTSDEPASAGPGHRARRIATGIAALLLAGSAGGGPAVAAAVDGHSFHEQFASAFTPGPMEPGDCDTCSIKLDPR